MMNKITIIPKASFLKMFIVLTLTMLCHISFAQKKTFIPASDTNIQVSGRVNTLDPNTVFFAFPGVSIKAKFQGTSIDALLTEYGSGTATTTNYLNVIIDGGEPTVLKLLSSQSIYNLASGLTDGTHTVELFKRTESNVGMVAFKGFMLDNSKKLLLPDALPKRKIEFIGNSITCGYGNELSTTTPDKYHFTSANENNYKAWGAVAARLLQAQYSCVAYSGRGLYQNNTGSKTGTLPLIYDNIIADVASSQWNHYNYIPDVVVINLGTNDFSAETLSSAYTVDSAVFVTTYVNFIKKLREYYPNASFVCCVGTMMNDGYPAKAKQWTRIQKYVSSVSAYFKNNGDSKVFYLKLEPQSSPYGEDWHPTAATDLVMANTLVNFINNNIKWNECPGSINLGKDINLKYKQTPITLSTHASAYNGDTYTWYKNGTVINGTTSSTYIINDSVGANGTYKVVRDSLNCKYEDELTVTNALKQVGAICKWQDNKKAAVVLTFDDWSAGHPAIVVPELKKRKMNATFFAVSSFVANWKPLYDAALDGNEIGNHTKTHPDITKLTVAQLDAEIKYTDSVINKNINIQKVTTFDYPFGTNNQTVINYLKNMSYVGARGVLPSSGNYTYNFAPNVNDYYKILTFALTSNTSISQYASELKNIVNGGGLLTYLYHSVNSPTVTDNNYAAVSQSLFQQQLDTICSYRNKIWITTFSNALKYHREARCASLVELESASSQKWVVNLTDTITDSALYNQPLSILLRLNGKQYDMIKQGKSFLKIDSVFNDTIMFKAIPNNGPITLSVSGIDVQSSISPLQFTNTNQTVITCNVQAVSSSGIKQVVVDLSTIGGDATTVLTNVGSNLYSTTFPVPAGTKIGYTSIPVLVIDNAENIHQESLGIQINSGINIGLFNIYQTTDSISLSLTVTDDGVIASVKADLTPLKGSYVSTFKKMNADSFYISIPRGSVTTGTKYLNFTITDNMGNEMKLYKAVTINPLSDVKICNADNSLEIFPNPATNSISFDVRYPEYDLMVYNNLGIEYYHVTNKNTSLHKINVSQWPEGVYLVSVVTHSGLYEKPFVVLR